MNKLALVSLCIVLLVKGAASWPARDSSSDSGSGTGSGSQGSGSSNIFTYWTKWPIFNGYLKPMQETLDPLTQQASDMVTGLPGVASFQQTVDQMGSQATSALNPAQLMQSLGGGQSGSNGLSSMLGQLMPSGSGSSNQNQSG